MQGTKKRAATLAIACSVGLVTSVANAEYAVSLQEMLEPGAGPASIAIRDIDADGRSDLIVTTSGSNDPENEFRVLVYKQQADGTLAEPTSFSYGGGRAINSGNLDKDSAKEIVVEHAEGIAILDWDVYRQRQVVRTNAHSNEFARSGYRIELIDIDRDGALDVVTKPFGRHIVLYFGDGQGGVRRTVQMPLSIDNDVDATSGDFNSDGHQDFVVLSSVLRAYVYLNNGTEGFSAPYVLNPNPTGGAFYPAIAAGDFNDDGRDDLIFTTDTGTLSLYEQNANGAMQYSRALSVEWASDAMQVQDVDLDGRADLLVMHGTLGLFRQGNDGLEPERPLAAGGAPRGFAVGDLNGDNCPDVATSASTSDRVDLYRGMGCQPVADLDIGLELSLTGITMFLQNLDSAPAGAPETALSLSVSSGTLVTGNMPEGCTLDAHDSRSARITCIGADIATGSASALTIPIAIQSSDRRNVVTASASTTTATVEVKLDNNIIRKSLRTFGL